MQMLIKQFPAACAALWPRRCGLPLSACAPVGRSLYEFSGPAADATQWSLEQAVRGPSDGGSERLMPAELYAQVQAHFGL